MKRARGYRGAVAGHADRRRCARYRYIAIAVVLLGVGSVLGSCEPESEVPTQWIAKQFTELLGRAPTQSEWSTWLSHYEPLECNYDDVTALTRQLAASSEFLNNYPENPPLSKSARFLALVRAAFSDDPNSTHWNTYFLPYKNGTATWTQTVNSVLADPDFVNSILPNRVCNQYEAGYGFRATAPLLDRRQLLGLGASRTQQQLQAAIDSAQPNTTVSLQQGEVVLIGGAANNNQGLVLRTGVTLSTAGLPGPDKYALMGRLVPAGSDALICDGSTCNNSAVVHLEPGARIKNVWVGGSGVWDSGAAFESNYKVANIETWGSSAAAATQIRSNRVSDPGRDGAAIRAHGFSVTGQACASEEISSNLITGYASLHRPDRSGQARWVDGIAVHCESSTVSDNQIVDVSDAGIMLYGSYNRDLGAGATQRSQVTNNTLLSAGLSAKVALGTDPIGVCRAVKDMRNPFTMSTELEQQVNDYLAHGIPSEGAGAPYPCDAATCQPACVPQQCVPWTWTGLANAFPACVGTPTDECAYVNAGVIVPCLDLPDKRNFDGTVVNGNVFTTSRRTHFDIGLMIGGLPRWGDHRVFGGCPTTGCTSGGVAVTNNTTGSVGAQAVTGISVAGMFDVLLTGNADSYTTGDPNPGVGWQKCPQVAVAVASPAFTSLQPGSQSHVQSDAMYGCDTDEPPLLWNAPIVLAADHTTLAQDLNEDGVADRRFYPWGFNYNNGEPNPDGGDPYDWDMLVRDFRSMRRMGANIVRIGPTFRQILGPPSSPDFPYGTPNQAGLDWLSNLLGLAQQTNIYVDLSYGWNQDPDWYLQTNDEDLRWGALAKWWSLVAGVAKSSTAVAWYSLKNEPLMPEACACTQAFEPCNGNCCAANPDLHDVGTCPYVDCPVTASWVNGAFNDFLARSRCGADGERTPKQIVRAWLTRMKNAIRLTENGGAGDTAHLLAIGSMGFTGVAPAEIADLEDFELEHYYPPDSASVTGYHPFFGEFQSLLDGVRTNTNTGQPRIAEEGFVLVGTQIALEAFMLQARPQISGWMMHYFNSKSPTAIAPPTDLGAFATLLTYQAMLRNTALFQPSGTGIMQP